jgi:hypothetical protein
MADMGPGLRRDDEERRWRISSDEEQKRTGRLRSNGTGGKRQVRAS